MRVFRSAVTVALVLIGSGAGKVWAADAPAETQAIDAQSEQANFENFLREFRSTALDAGISPDLYDRATAGISFNPRVEDLNEKQPEFIRPIWEYLSGVITPQRVERGRELIGEN